MSAFLDPEEVNREAGYAPATAPDELEAQKIITQQSMTDPQFKEDLAEAYRRHDARGTDPVSAAMLLHQVQSIALERATTDAGEAIRTERAKPGPAPSHVHRPERLTVSVFEASDLVRFRVHETVVTILPMPGFDLPAFTRWRKSRYHSGSIHLWETVGLYGPGATGGLNGTRYFRNSLDLANLLPISVSDAIKLDPNLDPIYKEGVSGE